MDRIRIRGGQRLSGEIPISGAKNAALPLMIASLLTEETLRLGNVPRLHDVALLLRILRNHGADTTLKGKRPGQDTQAGDTIDLTVRDVVDTTAPYDLVSRMRASFWVLGPLVARCGQARVSLPGGCAIGTRPVDLHLMALESSARRSNSMAAMSWCAPPAAGGGLIGGRISFPKVSVGATHNALMAATLAKGETVIENAAREPEVADLANCLVKMGANIEGMGTSTLTVQGVERLHGADHSVMADRIETGTYCMAAAMTGGDVTLTGAPVDLLGSLMTTMAMAGVEVTPTNDGIRVRRDGGAIQPVEVETAPYPGFPTDLQAQMMALVTRADGVSHIRETIFENRFMHVQELVRLGPTSRSAATPPRCGG
jgi:UDP-N-acetylglucosamine 1-carboxyvinyltransferase